MSDNFGAKGALDGLGRQSPYTQICIAAGTGLFIGYVFFKASKSVAIAAGGSILLAQLAIQSGLIKIDALETILLHGNPGIRGNIHVLPNVANTETMEIIMERLTKAYDIVASSRRLCVAMLGGFLMGFGLA
ncbi:uncharacterized protein LOC117901012 [Drosophila subobscura]|uniref:uncharacterized protein LOC117901012 n=1 Tax=Drosophila subobscura TaxID=7241 RepID=UPI00155B0A23|nr:uncharacterized protein LOC117901012 [Drosophila subobscura]